MASTKTLGHENSYIWGVVAKMNGMDELSSNPWFGRPVCWWISLNQKHGPRKTHECGGSNLCFGVNIQGSKR